jgi:hypothetical protein
MPMNLPFGRYNIEKGKDNFKFSCGLPDPEDYAIVALPNWNTTIFLVEKTNKGFTLGFGTPCPHGNGWLDLAIYSSPKSVTISYQNRTIRTRLKERKTKIPKEVGYV